MLSRRASGNGAPRGADAGVGDEPALAQAFLPDGQRDPGLLLEVDQRQVGQQRLRAAWWPEFRLPGADAGDERFRVGETGHGSGRPGLELVQQPLAAEAAEHGHVQRPR